MYFSILFIVYLIFFKYWGYLTGNKLYKLSNFQELTLYWEETEKTIMNNWISKLISGPINTNMNTEWLHDWREEDTLAKVD